MKHKLFRAVLSLVLMLSLATVFQPASGSCATKKVKLNVKRLTLTKNDTYTLRLYNLKKKHTVKFSSDDENVVCIKETASSGKSAVISAANIGSTCVRVHIFNRKSKLIRSLRTNVRVTPLAVSIKFAHRKVRLPADTTMKLSVLIKPDISQELPLFESSDTDVVTVNSKGIITAIAPGNATVTATLLSSGQKVSCDVTVLPELTEHPTEETEDG